MAADIVRTDAAHTIAREAFATQVFDDVACRDLEGFQTLLCASLVERGLRCAWNLPEMHVLLHHSLHDFLDQVDVRANIHRRELGAFLILNYCVHAASLSSRLMATPSYSWLTAL